MRDDEDYYKREDWMDKHGPDGSDPRVKECSKCGGELILVERYAPVLYGNPEPGSELWQCKCGNEEGG